MHVKEFIQAVTEARKLREDSRQVGTPESNKDFRQARVVPVKKDEPRINDTRKTKAKAAGSPSMGERSHPKGSSDSWVGKPDLNVGAMERRDVPVKKISEAEFRRGRDIDDPTGYKQRKMERTAAFHASHGKKMIKCTACNGSGRYDNTGSPKCRACGGKGKVQESEEIGNPTVKKETPAHSPTNGNPPKGSPKDPGTPKLNLDAAEWVGVDVKKIEEDANASIDALLRAVFKK